MRTCGRVHGFHLDGFAQEKVNLPARLLVPAPPGVDAVAAALAPVTFGTVEHMLFDNAKLEPGETILVHAGGSGIGTAAIQLAKKIGCTVITTVGSDDKIEKARALGADHVINYRTDRFEGVVRKLTKKKGVDVVFEHVGKDTWAGSMLVMKRGGRLVTCGSTFGRLDRDEPDDAVPAAAEAFRLLRLPHGEHGECHAEDGARARASRHRYGSDLLGYRPGSGAHGGSAGVRQDRAEARLTPMRMLITRLVLSAEHARQWFNAQVAFLPLAVMKLFPADPAIRFADRFARWLGPKLTSRHRLTLTNLRNAYPEKSEAELEAIALESWGNIGRMAAEYVFLDTLFDFDPDRATPAGSKCRV